MRTEATDRAERPDDLRHIVVKIVVKIVAVNDPQPFHRASGAHLRVGPGVVVPVVRPDVAERGAPARDWDYQAVAHQPVEPERPPVTNERPDRLHALVLAMVAEPASAGVGPVVRDVEVTK